MSALLLSRATSLLRRLWSLDTLLFLLGVSAIFWTCTYKIMDRDFWWHITAGDIFFHTHQLLRIDPFSHAREGLPYLASYEWLSQIILYLLYHWGSFTGIILFRGLVATTCIGILLLLTKNVRIAFVVLGVWAIVMTKGSFLERPQLFTFVLFSLFTLLAFRFLDAETEKKRRYIACAFVFLSYLWVNLHGGAVLLGVGIVTFVLLQVVTPALLSRDFTGALRDGRVLFIALAFMSLCFILPPNGLMALRYVTELHRDETITFIAEFQPRTWALYLRELWPFIILSIFALAFGKRHVVFNTLLLCSMAYLSRQAFRHEIFFVFACLATCFYQFDRSVVPEKILAWMSRRKALAMIAFSLLILLLCRVAYVRSFGFERQDNLFGFGQFDFARGAFDFLEREKIEGKMFNTYGIGGYLIHRGYPNRKVFIDGRNVDYGFDFMVRTYAAGIDKDRWDDLVHLYGITYAVIDYDATRQEDRLPYSVVLDHHPDWALVYLDDWTAVYLKRVSLNEDVIRRKEYRHLTASDVQFNDDFSHHPSAEISRIVSELRRMHEENPDGIKALLSLAKIAYRENRNEDAKSLAQNVRTIRPYAPESYAVLGSLSAREQNWQEAAQMYQQVLRLAGDNYPDLNHSFIADVLEKAGYRWKAWLLRPSFTRSGKQSSDTSLDATGTGALMANPAVDALLFHQQALEAVDRGDATKAEELLRTAIMLNPSAPEPWNNLCAVLLSQGRVKEAIDACKSAIQQNASYADAHFNLALAYYQDQGFKQAKKSAETARDLGRVNESEHLLLLIRKMDSQ